MRGKKREKKAGGNERKRARKVWGEKIVSTDKGRPRKEKKKKLDRERRDKKSVGQNRGMQRGRPWERKGKQKIAGKGKKVLWGLGRKRRRKR